MTMGIQQLQLEPNSTLHLYEQAANAIRQYITSNALPPGSPLPSTAEIAKALSLNHLTARRALLKLADQGLVNIVPCRGVFVGSAAFEKRILWIGGLDLANGDISSFYTDGLRRFNQQLRELGYVMDYAWLPNEKDKCDPYCRPEILDKYCGFVFYAGYNDHPVLKYVVANNAPYVHMLPGSKSPSHTVTCPRVLPTVCRSLEHFAERGHEHVDVIKIVSIFDTPEDIEMLLRTARSLRMRVRLHRVPDRPRKSDYIHLGDQLMASLLDDPDVTPDALCLADEIVARGVALRLLNHGVDRLPNLDVVVIGRDEEAMHLGLPVTPMSWDAKAAVTSSVAMLHEQLTGGEQHPKSIIFPYKIGSFDKKPMPHVPMEVIELA